MGLFDDIKKHVVGAWQTVDRDVVQPVAQSAATAFGNSSNTPAPMPQPNTTPTPAPAPMPAPSPQSTPSIPQPSFLSRAWDQVNPFDNGRTFSHPTPTQPPSSVWHQATHNGLTDVVGGAAKFVPQLALDYSNAAANLGRAAAGVAPQTPQQQFTDPFTKSLTQMSDPNGTLRQMAGDVAQVGLTAAAPAVDNLVGEGVSKLIPKAVPAIVPKVVTDAATGAALGGPAGVANLAATNAPFTGSNVVDAFKQGVGTGAAMGAGGAVAAAAAPHVITAVKQISPAIDSANHKMFGTDPTTAQGGYIHLPQDASNDLVQKVFTKQSDANALYHGTQTENALGILRSGKIKAYVPNQDEVFSPDLVSLVGSSVGNDKTPYVSFSRQRNIGFKNNPFTSVRFVVDNDKLVNLLGKTTPYVDGGLSPVNSLGFEAEQRINKDVPLSVVKRIELRHHSDITPQEEKEIRALASGYNIPVVRTDDVDGMRAIIDQATHGSYAHSLPVLDHAQHILDAVNGQTPTPTTAAASEPVLRIRLRPNEEPIEVTQSDLDAVLQQMENETPKPAARSAFDAMSPEEFQSLANSNPGTKVYDNLEEAPKVDPEQVKSFASTFNVPEQDAERTLMKMQASAEPPTYSGNPVTDISQKLTDNVLPEYSTAPRSGAGLVQARVEGNVQMADDLAQYIRQQLPDPKDRVTLQLYLDGSLKDAPGHVQAVADELRPLYEQAAQIRAKNDPEFSSLSDYAPRITEKAAKLFNPKLRASAESGFNQPRAIYKFVDSKGDARIGSTTKLNLAQTPDGKFVDKEGNEYKRERATQQEIVDSGAQKYQLDAARNARHYLADTMRMKEHADFIQYLKSIGRRGDGMYEADPSGYGMQYTPPEEVPEGWVGVKAKGLEGYYFNPKTAKFINSFTNEPDTRPPFVKAVAKGARLVNNASRALILNNPVVHPLNLELNALTRSGSPAGAMRFIFNQLRGNKASSWLGMDEGNLKYYQEYKQAGGSSFGAGQHSAVEDLARKVTNSDTAAKIGHYVDNINPGSLNHRLVAASDEGIRLALFRSLRERGLNPRDAAAEVNKALVDYNDITDSEKTLGRYVWFYPWLKGNAKNVADLARHPVVNKGNIATMAIVGASLLAAQDAWRKYTGNKHATLRFPGVFGIIKSIIEIPEQIMQHQVPGFVSGHISPYINEAVQQLTGTDSFTKRPIVGTGDNPLVDRLGHVADTFVGNSQTVSKSVSGRKSPEEAALNFLGATVPHTKGAPAAPKLTSGPLAGLNLPGAKAAAGNDATGIDQMNAYYNALDHYAPSAQKNPNDAAAWQLLHPTQKNASGNYIVQPTYFDTPEKAAIYLAHPDILKADDNLNKQLGQDGQKVDPFFTQLTPDQQKAYLEYQTMAPDGPDQKDWRNKNKWYSDFETARNAFFSSLPAGDPNKPRLQLQYPQPTDAVSQLMDQYSKLTDGKTKVQFLTDHPEVQDQFAKISDYYNQLRQQRGLAAFKDYPTAPAAVQNFITSYMAADKAGRKTLRTNNADLYNQMNDYFSRVDLYDIDKQGALSELQGEPDTTNQELKDIYNLGKYDIYKDPVTGLYSIDPNAAFGANGPGAGSNYYKSHKRIYLRGKGGSLSALRELLSSSQDVSPNHFKIKTHRIVTTPGVARYRGTPGGYGHVAAKADAFKKLVQPSMKG